MRVAIIVPANFNQTTERIMIPFKQNRAIFAILLFGATLASSFAQQAEPQEVADPKGAIIIASLEGQVTVTNNATGQALPAAQVAVGKLLFDGHTVKTAKGAKLILLFSTGTVTTLKEDSTLNIKKFTQAKFDPKGSGRLSDRDDEPSPSDTLIDLSVGDMVVDVKKLKKESSFSIDSPVGTAGIRGTIGNPVVRGNDFKFNQITGLSDFIPKGGGAATRLVPGQSLAGTIGPGGLLGVLQLGQVPRGLMRTIKAEVKEAASTADKSTGGDGSVGPSDQEKQPQGEEDEAPSEEEINESDDERGASAKGVDDNGSEAVALEKSGLIDLDDPKQLEQVETFVEVTDKAAAMFKDKQDEEETGRKDGHDESKSFLDNLTKRDDEPYKKDKDGNVVNDENGNPVPNENFGKLPLANVVDVAESADSVGA